MLKPIDYNLTTSTGFMFSLKDGNIEHFKVEHPGPLDNYLRHLPRVHSVSFDFGKSAYKKTSVDEVGQIEEVLRTVKLTRVSITGSKKITALPESITEHPIQFLRIVNCPNLQDIKFVLSRLNNLEHLELSGDYFDVGGIFPHLSKLKYFKSSVKSFSSLNQISACVTLEGLEFWNYQDGDIPEEISTLRNLKALTISGHLEMERLPSLNQCSQLENLRLFNLNAIKAINIDFSNKSKLINLSLQNLGSNAVLDFPERLTNCRQLKILNISRCNFPAIPESFAQLTSLEYLSLTYLEVNTFPEVFGEMKSLNNLALNSFTNLKNLPSSISKLSNLETLNLAYMMALEAFNIDISGLEKLNHFWLTKSPELKRIDHSLAANTSVEKIHLEDLPQLDQLPELGTNNLNLKELVLQQIPNLTILPSSITTLLALEKLKITSTGIQRLPENIGDLKNLINLNLFGEAFEYFPTSIALLPNLNQLTAARQTISQDSVIVSIREIFPTLNKLEDVELKKAILFWAGNSFQYLQLTESIKNKSFEALQHNLKNIHLLILNNIHRFNPNQKVIQLGQLKSGDQVWINGTIQGSKTDFKKKLKELDCKVVTKFSSEIRLVIIGKKAIIPEGLFDSNLLFASQLEIENISKIENPGMLQEKDVPDDFIYNLQQLLWSGDPQNESIALELVKTNGLPEAAEEDFLLAGKICKDKNLRNRIRTFLRGKVSEEKQKALSTGSAPFKVAKLKNVLSDKSMARMYFAHAKQTGKLDDAYFSHDPKGQHEHRTQAFEMALSIFLTNPKYLKSYVPLLESEWNQVFAHPLLKGQLKRIVLPFGNLDKIPERLFDHIESLKDVEVSISKTFKIEDWYRFYKLNKLNIGAENFEIIPSGVGQLKRLRYLRIYSSIALIIPDDIRDLIHLKQAQIQNWANRGDFTEFLENLKK